MYVGGKGYVSKLNVNDYNTIEVCAKVKCMCVLVVFCSVTKSVLSWTSGVVVSYNEML